ncbi:hypothetical protein HBP98_00715 [Listeria booriae]|uniref:Uncharacterized protein n=1 Tax=Listeria booriae TaxID=1552123 RepID=A0A7X1A3D2_9LIST|nr:hypothetical protein [Listeria booriae]MBC2370514.1 hypothetical protein [Listeria booriae]
MAPKVFFGLCFINCGVACLLLFANKTLINHSLKAPTTSYAYLIALLLILIGLVILSYQRSLDKTLKEKLALDSVFIFLAIILGTQQLLSSPVGFNTFTFLAIFIFGFAFTAIIRLLMQITELAYKKFKSSIRDPKDRYTIVIGIFATIISLIAIFK